MADKDPAAELLDLRAILGDTLQEQLTADDLAEIVSAAVADAKLKDNPAAAKARRWLLDVLDAMTGEELDRLRGSERIASAFTKGIGGGK